MIKNQQLLLNQLVRQNEGNIVSDMGGEKVMLSLKNGKYYNLGEMGGVIWELINDPMTIRDLVIKLRSEYDVEQQQCEEQVQSFLTMLADEGLIHVEES
ncbi:lasso peptide biosynthesis PqqD family chaperone [Halobacillus amylolyticus]|uniref:Lasso peptide biosynthesis PqqD family chaperone n=1 Tax=Halobacillus amylolyticus TaxID=2932259 RepID=A0ABY4HJV4_9BACI|nr:lasso peptide biosynthesis PqqD family chaperone [Halobacillus amylolyticus]UOR13775.1 lasso peptide biosynthesis PqqD family chaperone [Halobacillus amylolyticus]